MTFRQSRPQRPSCPDGPAAPSPGAGPGPGPVPETGRRFYGKYRGTVLDNVDPEGVGRILAVLPAFTGSKLNWALPCVPYAGPEVGFFAIPPIGANVWIEFEGGDPSHPIWSGCFWETGEVPLAEEVSPEDPSLVKVFRSDFCSLIMNDTPEEGGLTLSVIDPAVDVPVTMKFDSLGVQITCGASSVLINPEEGITIKAAESTVAVSDAAVSVSSTDCTVTATSSSIESVVEVTGDTSISGAVQIEGDTAINGAVQLDGETNVVGALTAEAECNVAGLLTSEGDCNVLGLLTVEGEANFALLVTIEGDCNILGAGQVEGNWAVIGLIEGVVVPPLL